MPRHDGRTANREHRKHGAHRMHRRTSDVRRRARVTKRPALRTWDRDRWLDKLADEAPETEVSLAAVLDLLTLPPLRMGRKNHPAKPPTPQKPKEQGRGGRGGKGGKPR